MKKPIGWHKNCYYNIVDYYNREFERVQRELHKVAELQKEKDFYKLQIETAIKEKKDGFDSEKFLIKRKK